MRVKLLIVVAVLMLIGCAGKEKQLRHDMSSENVFLISNITAENVSINGIGLGASVLDVLNVFGEPDNRKEYILEGETNLEYGVKINLSDNGLIFHFDNGTLTRFTLKQPYTDHYQTATQLNFTKREVYDWFGLPDKQTPVLNYMVYTYKEKGIDIFLKGRNVNRISFFRE
ncbi:hypothetical protein HY639_00725 [Candidatus Woesearchaeota archaeon]|nr:hypothetical protein [Candidatus Woesearchaeota archaeon]